MKRHSFTDFKYQLVDSNVLDKKCVEVTFLFDGKSSIHYVFIDKDKGNYISEAKRIVDAQLKSGKLARIGRKCARVRPFPNIVKPLLISLACVVGVGAVGATGYFAYKTLTTQSEGGGGGDTPEPTPPEPTPTDTYVVIFKGTDCSATLGGEEFVADLFSEGESLELVVSPEESISSHYKLDDNSFNVLLDGKKAPEDYFTFEPISKTNNYKLTVPSITGKTEIKAITTEYCWITYECEPATKEPVELKKGLTLEGLIDPIEYPNYIFLNWYNDQEYLSECTASQIVLEDTTLYGRFVSEELLNPLTFTCTAADDGGATIKLLANNSDLEQTFTRNLFYRIITASGAEGEWTPIADADGNGNFDVEFSPFQEEISIFDGSTLLQVGDQIQFAGDNDDGFSYAKSRGDRIDNFVLSFNSEEGSKNRFDLSGNVMSLLDRDEFSSLDEIPCGGCFIGLFGNNSASVETHDRCHIVNAKDLILPANVLSDFCYAAMFKHCEFLETAPKLSATNLSLYCYMNMFSNCTSLVQAPELPAENLSIGCYFNMFGVCSALIVAPDLPAKRLAMGCYLYMFIGCESLETAELSFTIFSGDNDSCCAMMFDYCYKLSELKVGFGDDSGTWPCGINEYGSTYLWLSEAGTAVGVPTFYWKGPEEESQIEFERSESTVPDGWAIKHY